MNKLFEILQEKMSDDVFTEEVKTAIKDEYDVLVAEKVNAEVAELREQFEQELTEKAEQEIAEFKEDYADKLDQYLTYCAQTFFKENKAAYESSFKVELAENILGKVKGVLESYHVEVPKAKAVVIEQLKESKTKADKTVANLAKDLREAKAQIFEYEKALTLQSMTTELTEKQKRDVIDLLESVEVADMKEFKRKAKICIERVTDKKVKMEEVVEERIKDEKATTITEKIHTSLLPKKD